MIRELLLAATVLVVVAACASTSSPTPPAHATTTRSQSPTTTPSPPSSLAGITSQESARLAPLAPAHLTAVADTGTVRLTWPATGEDLAYYQCLRRTAPTGQWRPVGRASSAHTYLDHSP